MKKIILFLLVLLAANCKVEAQAPQGFNFQGIALDSIGYVVASKLVSLRFSISTDSLGNLVSYRETASAQTDKYGQFTAVIGNGVPSIGRFSSIIWSTGSLYMKTEIDIANTGKYVVTGLSKLLSVPYALQANSASNINSDSLQNTRVGSNSLYKNTTGQKNTATGDSSLYSNTTGSSNTAGGYQSLYSNTTGRSNTANGQGSLGANTTGVNNTANGFWALFSNTTASGNTAIGLQSLYMNTTGAVNTAIGYFSLASNTTGGSNSANGREALYKNTTGSYNTANGSGSLTNITGNNNTAIGYNSGAKLTTGDKNIFIGNEAGNNNNFKTSSNKLVIQNDSSLTPLIYGEFDIKKLTINGDLTVTGNVNSKELAYFRLLYNAPETQADREQMGVAIGKGALANLSDSNAQGNLAIGRGAGSNIRKFSNEYNNTRNLMIGYTAGSGIGSDISGAQENIAIGNYNMVNIPGSASNNVIIGNMAARFAYKTKNMQNEVFNSNIGLGDYAFEYAGNSYENIGIGGNVFGGGLGAFKNVAIGTKAANNFHGSRSIILGDYAGSGDSTFGANNIIIGASAAKNLSGSGNIILGYNGANDVNSKSISNRLYIQNDTLAKPLIYGEFDNKKLTINGDLTVTGKISGGEGILSDAYSNTKAGSSALDNNKFGSTSGTVAIGDSALKYNYGRDNTAIGSRSMQSKSISSGSSNTAIGNASLYSISQGNGNTASGVSSLYSNTNGSANTSSGYLSIYSNTIGYSNTAMGVSSLFANTTGSRNTALGDSSMLKNTTGSFNTATGYLSLSSNTTGEFNSAYGSYSMEKNTTGSENIAFGGEAFRNNTTGSFNVAVGTGTLGSNTTGGENTAIGRRAMNNNVTGTFNTAIGQAALYANRTGSNNTAMGRTSLVFNTGGEGNTAIGATSITNNTTGNNNTGIGNNVLGANTTGSQNTAIGYNAGAKTTSGDKNIFIGNEAGNNSNFSAVSNKLVIDNSNRPDPFVVGDFSSRKLIVNGDPASLATLEIKNGDTYISNPNKGIILTSPNGSCWRVTVDNAGALLRTSVACPSSLNPKLGDVYQGGIVFYIDSTGEHGLVAAATDLSAGGTGWGCNCTLISGLDSAFGSGSNNTAEIVRQCANAGIAAKECDLLVLNGYSDWYLPSKLELDLMYTKLKLNGLGNFLTNMPYWSSTPASYGSCGATGGAWTKNFGTGANIADARNGYAGTGAVRAIRSF